jgi:hypothetical protein
MIIKLFEDSGAGGVDAEAMKDIRVSVRTSRDLYDFLTKWPSNAPQAETEYLVNTVRSGIDSFFAIALLFRILDTTDITIHSWKTAAGFMRLRHEYLKEFENLSKSGLTFARRLAGLVMLCQAQLIFLADNFRVMFEDIQVQ